MVSRRLHLYRVSQVTQFDISEPSGPVITINKNVVRFDICSPVLGHYGRLVSHEAHGSRHTCMCQIQLMHTV